MQEMGWFILLISALACLFKLNKTHYLILIGFNMLIGLVYLTLEGLMGLGIPVAFANGLLTFAVIGLKEILSELISGGTNKSE
ncbi:hypothetical protein E3U55_11170 [Filobacillus milosensis]|uniref:Uncharacterized protein n=1 Tax=Filobacillus milosensis TaxID=94137 RepID=A0A4Y8IG07_9BACI|nr:hypothetical protein [Filobacillus milosensis]TFB19265.1 hypothetical protein E3U55_11170 [Filobacillus milosensis]